MRFEFKIHQEIEGQEPYLAVVFFSKHDEEHEQEGWEEGVYHCVNTIPEDREELIGVIEQAVNACIDIHERKEGH